MSKEKFVLLLGRKLNAIEVLKGWGYTPILISDTPEDQGKENSYYFDQEESKKSNYDLALFDELFKLNIVAIIVCLEDFVHLGAILRERFNFPKIGPSIDQAKVLRDKIAMKQLALSAQIPTTRFVEISPLSEFHEMKLTLNTPFLLKPRNGWLAQGIYKISNEAEWKEALGKINDVEYYFAEEFLQDIKEYCCDTLVANGQIVAQFPGEYSVSCLESSQTHEGIGVCFPGFLDSQAIDKLKQYTKSFIQKSGVRDGFFHTEFLWSPKEGWKFGEVGCRLPGGNQLPTESHIVGVNLLELYLRMFIPELRPDIISPLPHAVKYAGYYLFPKNVGRVTKIETKELDNLNWIHEFKIHVKEGDVLTFEDSSVTTAAVVLYTAQSLEELKERAATIRDLVKIRYD